MKEIWKVVEDFPKYEVSNLGRVRHIKSGRIKRPPIDSLGYYSTVLCNNDRPVKQKTKRVHRLVAEAFLPNRSHQVNHIDCDKLNNNVMNLEWCTTQENTAHAVANGRFRKGSECPFSKLTQSDVDLIKKLQYDISGSELSRIFGVKRSTICDIIKGRTWRERL